MKKGILGPGDCKDTIEFAENLPHYASAIARRHGYEVDPEEITTPYGVRLSSHNLEEGIAISGIQKNRREIRRDIINEIGCIDVIFV